MSENNAQFAKELLDNVGEILKESKYPEFSLQAIDELKESISNYISLLINESIKNSYRARNNQISNDNVQQATKSLIGSVNKKGPKIANIFGGILLGAFFTLFLKFCTENTMNHVETLFMMIFGIAGTVLIVYGILIE